MFGKKFAGVILLALAMVFLLAASASAETDFTITYLYYDDGEAIIRVDYADALEKAMVGDGVFKDPTLYNAAVAGVIGALSNFRSVWVELEIDGFGAIILNYNDVLTDRKTIAEARDAYPTYTEARPEYTRDLIIEGGRAVTTPAYSQDWLGDITISWIEIGGKWLVDVLILEAELPGEYDLQDLDAVLIKGKEAIQDPENEARWRSLFDAEKLNFYSGDIKTLVVTNKDVAIVIDGTTYSWDN